MRYAAPILIALASSASASNLFQGLHEASFTSEGLASSDIKVFSHRADWSLDSAKWDLEAALSLTDYSIDYSPTIITDPSSRDEETWFFSAGVTREWNQELATSVSARIYEGFADYRSIWIAEFYRQLFGETEQYFGPDPYGFGVTLSTTWEYFPNRGRVEFSYDYGRDEIAPGWGGGPNGLVPGNDLLHTHTGSIRFEHALTSWLETELRISGRQTTSRDPRYSVRHQWAAAAGPLGFRAGVGYAEENPEFESFYYDLLVEWLFHRSWSAYASARIYDDTGEIENAGFNPLAPSLDSSEIFGGLRYESANFSLNAGLGFLDSDYSEIPPTSAFFGQLYRDREWWSGRLSASYRF